jgi:acyl carrier protein
MSEPTKDAVEAEIHGLIREFSAAVDITIKPHATFDDLSISSLDVLQIIFRIEEAHDISIDTEGFYAVKTVADVVDYVWAGLTAGTAD